MHTMPNVLALLLLLGGLTACYEDATNVHSCTVYAGAVEAVPDTGYVCVLR